MLLISPWAGEETPNPDDEETTRVVAASSCPAILVSLPELRVTGSSGRAKAETYQVLVILVLNNNSHEKLLFGHTATNGPVLGVYDLIEVIRARLDHYPLTMASGETFSLDFQGHRRIDQFAGKLSWQIEYRAGGFRSEYNPIKGDEFLELIQSRVNQRQPTNPVNPVISLDTEIP